MKIGIIDTHYINNRKYPLLFEFFNLNNIKLVDFNMNICINNNHYSLDTSDDKKLFNLKYKGFHLFNLYKTELLFNLIKKHNWIDFNIKENDFFQKAFKENKKELIEHIQRTMFFIDYWPNKISLEKPRINYILMYKGSLIYQKTLLEISKTSIFDVILIDDFFIEDYFFIEQKYEIITNNSDIQFKNIFDKYIFKKNNTLNNIILKSFNINKKNIKEQHNILILGQKINSLSILEEEQNAFYIYKEIIFNILNKTDYNIIFQFKEENNNINNLIRECYMNLSGDKRNRISLSFGNDKLAELIQKSDIIITINSQNGLLVPFFDKKIILLEKSFYNNDCFTINDYCSKNINSLINDIKNKKIDILLSKKNKEEYIKFMSILINQHLFNNLNFKENFNKLVELFKIKVKFSIKDFKNPKYIYNKFKLSLKLLR